MISNPGSLQIIGMTLPALSDPSIAIAASRAGGIGILDLEFPPSAEAALRSINKMAGFAGNSCGIKLSGDDNNFIKAVTKVLPENVKLVVFTLSAPENLGRHIKSLHQRKRLVMLEVTSLEQALEGQRLGIDGIIVKGNEAGGLIGEKTAFVLLQQTVAKTKLPVWVQGGIGLHTAAACYAAGASGVVLDFQLSLTGESPVPSAVRKYLARMDGAETVCLGGMGPLCRIYKRPGVSPDDLLAETSLRDSSATLDHEALAALRSAVRDRIAWDEAAGTLWPVGQDAAFAASFANRFGSVGAIFNAIRRSLGEHVRSAKKMKILEKGSPLALSHGTDLPVVQGPMARVSDNAAFLAKVADEGGLPFVALAQMRPAEITPLIKEVAGLLGNRPWGVGLLGFVKSELFDSQVEAVEPFSPKFAIIAGALPNQVALLESKGIKTYVHIPSPAILDMFVDSGARRFIFEGNECGGHIGPRAGLVLWETMIERLLEKFKEGHNPAEFSLLFAGGIHDAASSAAIAVMAAPLAGRGAKVGIQMGTAYLLTKEITETAAISAEYQKNALRCLETRILETSPGHVLRCCDTPFAKTFVEKKRQMGSEKLPSEEVRNALEKLIVGKSRIASKGLMRNPSYGTQPGEPYLVKVDSSKQRSEGLYLIGQLAALRDKVFTIKDLHVATTEGAAERLRDLVETMPEHIPAGKKSADIAIIGMSCYLPKAKNIEEYWENILNKVNTITQIPAERWDWRMYFREDRTEKDKIYSRWGGFLDDMVFDPTRYGMPPKSIESVDPMQLMALEVAWRTLVDAGYGEREFDRERTSVIIGASGGAGDVGMQYGLRSELPRFHGDLPDPVARRLPEWTEDTFAGILPNVVAGRIANRLNLGGVNFTTDAACASSLAAIYQAVGELVSGRSNMVIAGGVDTVMGPFGYMCFSKTQALSPRGICCTFDASADGIVISEGIAMVALKRLEDAERDGDRIYAVIKGVGGSSDGKAKGLTAPLPSGQLRALRRAYELSGFGPETVDMFEAHGTGTVAGDTAELESTTALLREAGCRPHKAVIGSVKTMIGHTKATAGIAGLIKAALALHHRILPPHAGVNQPNQVLLQPDTPLYLPDQPMPWLTVNDQPRRAAVSAFGFGGTNFHVVLEDYKGEYRPHLETAPIRHWPAELLFWRGADREDLTVQLTHIQQALGKAVNIELRDLACSLAEACRSGSETIAIVAKDTGDLADKITAGLKYLAGGNAQLPPGIYHGTGQETAGKIAVLFPGQGSQYTGMSRELALHFPVFAETLSEADGLLSECFSSRFGEDMILSRFIFPRGCYTEQDKADAAKALTGTDVAQPALGAVEAGFWKFMSLLGLRPDMLAGHSYGEFVALFAGGVIDFDTLMALSEARGRFIVDAARKAGTEMGTMAAVQAERDYVEKTISDIEGVIVANHNAPRQCVISGSIASVEKAVARFSQAGIHVSRIPVAAAFHSRFVKPARSALAGLIKKTVWREAEIPVYSNTTGEPHAKDIEITKKVMTDHLVRPVEFLAQVEAMYHNGARVFLELGPKTVLSRLVGRILEGRPHKTIAIDDNGSGIAGMLHAVGQLLSAGVCLDITRLFEGRGCIASDPSHLDRLVRPEPDLRHAWLLNGSRARRAADPVKRIGISMDEQDCRASRLAESGVPLPSGTGPGPMARNRFMSRKPRKEEPQMGDRRQTPIAGESVVMAKYFDMMRQFIETQERIMSLYMGGGAPAGRRFGLRPSRYMQPQTFTRNFEEEQTQSPPQSGPPPQGRTRAVSPAETHARVELPEVPSIRKEAPASQMADVSSGEMNANDPAERFDRGKITETLLGIIEEKTGYPRDMVGLDQNLEADLGIDSIKRVEIVGALMKALPLFYGKELGQNVGGLSTQSTLNGMLNLLDGIKSGEGATVPFAEAGRGATTYSSSRPFRHIIESKQEPIDEFALKNIAKGRFIITRDSLGVAEELSALLTARGCSISIVERGVIADDDSLGRWCNSLGTDTEDIAGIVHLAQIGSDWLPVDAPIQEWRKQLLINEKSIFLLLHNLYGRLRRDAHILSVSSLGGFFGRNSSDRSGLSLQGGSVGLLKSLFEERGHLRVKAVDVDPEQNAKAIAVSLMAELELEGGRQEVGYPGGARTIFRTIPRSLDLKAERPEMMQGLVVLATGGLKGITAELLRELALPGNTLLLTGRSALPADEPGDLKSLTTPADLRQHFISGVRAGRLKLTPAEIGRKVQSVLAAREMRNNINDFRSRGAIVEYFAVDVTNDDEMRHLLDSLYSRYGSIGGVVHGAGIIEDKLLSDKTGKSWSRVVETKVVGLLLLQKYLRPESLKFLTVMSSVAGRYGNSGQTDYATANELMNRLCCQLSSNWGGKVKVRAFCWGPWGPTRFGTGMVTAETEAKFAEKGVTLVSAEAGRGLFKNELNHRNGAGGEIVCGEGSWEQHEAGIGRVKRDPRASEDIAFGPLLDNATLATLPRGEKVITFSLGDNHAYIQEHCMDDIPVLPAAAALEIMSEAAGHLSPGLVVAEARDCRMFKGIDLKERNQKFSVVIGPTGSGNGNGFEVTAAVQSEQDGGARRLHYRSVLRLQKQLPAGFERRPQGHAEKTLTVDKAYNEWLFHGPILRVITGIDGLSEAGAVAVTRTTSPSQWLMNANHAKDCWIFDPAIIDAAAQMASLWTRAFRNETALPARFGRVVRFSETLPGELYMNFERLPSEGPHLIRSNVYFTDAANNVMLLIEDMECVSSFDLNRVGGTAKISLLSAKEG